MKLSVQRFLRSLVMAIAIGVAQPALADAVTDWNAKAADILVEGRLGPAPAHRAMAIIHTAVYEAVNAATRRYPASMLRLDAAPGASADAAVAAACRTTLLKLAPSQQAAIESAYQAALAKLGDGDAKSTGIALGDKAAAAVLAARADDGIAAQESYRPHAAPSAYVPTVFPAAPTWPQRKPWLMNAGDQFRPGPPPALSSPTWVRDYNEIKVYGVKNGSRRSAEQTAIATFWEATHPPVYAGIVRSVANAPGRDITRNARLFATVTQAMDDALIAVFDAKYAYNFWRPVTAIRNGDTDGNDATERDPSWVSFIESPLHPEYPCAHCTLAGAVGAVLRAELASGPVPTLTTNSPYSKSPRSFTQVDAFVQEVANARVYDGVHFRNSTEVGSNLGRQIGELAATKMLRPLD